MIVNPNPKCSITGSVKDLQRVMAEHGTLRVTDCQNETPSQPDELVAASVLDRAKAIVTGSRQTTHGKPERSFEHIAARWSLTLGMKVTPFQVALMMADMKQVRALEGVTEGAGEDHLVDMVGYVALAGEMR